MLEGGAGCFAGAGGTISNVVMDTRFYETIKNANTGIWASAILGQFSGPTGPAWSATIDQVTLNGTSWSDNGQWQATVSGTITDAANVTREVSGIASGITTASEGSVPNTFKGSGVGTWTRGDDGATGGSLNGSGLY